MRFFVVEGFWMNVDLCEEKPPKAARLNQDVWSIEVLKRVHMRTCAFFTSRILIGCILYHLSWGNQTNPHICGPFKTSSLPGPFSSWPWLALQPQCQGLHALHPPGVGQHPNDALRYWFHRLPAPPCWRRRWVGWWWRNGPNIEYARRRVHSGGTKGEKKSWRFFPTFGWNEMGETPGRKHFIF